MCYLDKAIQPECFNDVSYGVFYLMLDIQSFLMFAFGLVFYIFCYRAWRMCHQDRVSDARKQYTDFLTYSEVTARWSATFFMIIFVGLSFLGVELVYLQATEQEIRYTIYLSILSLMLLQFVL